MTDSERQLVDFYLDGGLPESEHPLLFERLETDPGALAYLAARSQLNVDLRRSFKRRKLQQMAVAAAAANTRYDSQKRTRAFWRSWRPLTAAAAAVLIVVLFLFGQKTVAVPVGTFLRSEDAVWKGQTPMEGGRLHAGYFRLRGGRAMLRLDGGAQLLLRGAVDLRLDDGGSVTLLAGEVRAEVPEPAKGFTIHTPGGKVVDLGTEFIASVNREGRTDVSVLKGEVEVPDGNGLVHRLSTGEALALDRRGVTHPVIARAGDNAWQPWAEDKANLPRAGKLLLRETFDYPEGDHDPAVLTGGSGWSGPWTVFQGKHDDQPWSAKMHQMEVGIFEGRKAWVSPVGKTRCQRLLARPISLKQDAVHYVSLCWFEEALPPEHRDGEFWPRANLMIDLRGASDSGPGQRVGLRTNHLMRPIIESGAGQGFNSRVVVGDGRRLMMVGKILSRREGEDEVFLRCFDASEPPGLVEPVLWDVVTRGLRLDAVLDRVVLESIGAKPRRIEEIRIGTTWHDVVAGWDSGSNHHP